MNQATSGRQYPTLVNAWSLRHHTSGNPLLLSLLAEEGTAVVDFNFLFEGLALLVC